MSAQPSGFDFAEDFVQGLHADIGEAGRKLPDDYCVYICESRQEQDLPSRSGKLSIGFRLLSRKIEAGLVRRAQLRRPILAMLHDVVMTASVFYVEPRDLYLQVNSN